MVDVQRRIEDYAMIGDCRSAALVGRDGSIDWLCWPRFDSPACFAALLGDRDNGRWLMAPPERHRSRRRYRDCTLVLETDFDTEDGGVTVVDFMPSGTEAPSVVRRVLGRSGRVLMQTELILRFDYGLTVPWVRCGDAGELLAIAGPNQVVLHAPVPLHGEGLRSVARFEVGEGDCLDFVLRYTDSTSAVPAPLDAGAELRRAESDWGEWCARCADAGRWTGLVRRSLLTVRGLTYHPTGGIVAAPTTSLPERLGGSRNWDYRYCWVRDATLTLRALMRGGYHEEAASWRDWLTRAVAGSPEQLQILYGVAGERDLAERELPWLAGFAGSRPVRVGNAASEQFQLDIFGELAGMLRRARQAGLPANERASELLRAMVRHLEQTWQEPDKGIWEMRGAPQHFTYSKVMAWLAFRSAANNGTAVDEAERRRWLTTADRIHAEVCAKAYDAERNCFTQSYGSSLLDASLLLLPRSGFLRPQDPRIVGTVTAIKRHLLREGLVLRYETASGIDGLPPGEGAFLACSFWLVDCYVMLGRLDDAGALFEQLGGLCNDVGLLAEEFDPRERRMLGNFPQAFSHLALVNAAYMLARAEGGKTELHGPELA